MARRWFKWILILLAAGGVAGALIWYLWKREHPPVSYRTAVIARGPVIQAVTATGQLNPVVNVQVGSQISGIIQQLFADYNSRVTNGQIIAQLDASTYKANVRQAEGDLASARAALELAQINAGRAKKLRADDLIAQSDYDKTVADLHQAEAATTIREAALERARIDLSRTTIYAPIDGDVISRNVDVGQTVAASLSAPILFVIANDLSKMQIDANVAEADVGGIEIGKAVNFTVDAYPDRTFTGSVAQVRNAPTTVQNVVTYDTIIDVANTDLKLKPGMTANVSIIVDHRDDVLRVPNAAFRFRPTAANGAQDSAKNGSGPARQRDSSGRRSATGRGSDTNRPALGPAGPPRVMRTVYLPPVATPSQKASTTPESRQVAIGVSDGAFTEVISGLNENDVVILGAGTSPSNAGRSPTLPFAGGMGRPH